MPQNSNDSKSSSNAGVYVATAVLTALAAGAGYLIGKNSESPQTSSAHSNRSNSSGNRNYHKANVRPTQNYVDRDTDCAICLDKMQPVRTLPCNHKFHEGCMSDWLNTKGMNRVCPKCLHEVN